MTILIFGFYRASVINKLTRYNANRNVERERQRERERKNTRLSRNHKTLKRAAIFYGQVQWQWQWQWHLELASSSSSSSPTSFHLLCCGSWGGAGRGARGKEQRQTNVTAHDKSKLISFYLFIYLSIDWQRFTTLFNIDWIPKTILHAASAECLLLRYGNSVIPWLLCAIAR